MNPQEEAGLAGAFAAILPIVLWLPGIPTFGVLASIGSCYLCFAIGYLLARPGVACLRTPPTDNDDDPTGSFPLPLPPES